jgi:serine protease
MRGRAAAAAVLAALALGGLAATATAPAAEQPGDPLVRYQWHLRAIQAQAAWQVVRGAGATVAVLDTGVAYENRGPYRRASELAATRVVPGWDFVDDDAHPDDIPPADGRRSHGTHMATIIAAGAGNGIGGAGVAPDARIMPVRVLEPDLSGTARRIARGLRFAADHGADVANLSIAGPAPSRVLREAVEYARAKGVTIVAAAGNDGRASVSWPAAYPGVIAVGAVDRAGKRAGYSNYGDALDLVAPGGSGELVDVGYGPRDGVQSQTLIGGPAQFCFCFMASTSAAAAEVSGVAALLIASGRATTPAAVRAAMVSSARASGTAAQARQYGAGLVQARAALEAVGAARAAVPARSAPRADKPSASGWLVAAVTGAALLGLVGAAALWRRRRGATANADG